MNSILLEHPVPQPITVEQYELLSKHGLLPENVELSDLTRILP